MTEYTATFVRALIGEVEPTRAEAPDEEALGSAVEILEGMEGLLTRLPAPERHEALSGVALERDGVLWVPMARNCRLSAGVAVEPDGFVSFAVGNESSAGEALVAHFSRGPRLRTRYMARGIGPGRPGWTRMRPYPANSPRSSVRVP
jgi:hypothetical protein